MSRLFRTSSALLLVAMLAGCGTHLAPVSATSAAVMDLQAKAVTAVDPQVQQLIKDYQAITGYDAAAMQKREDIVDQLGDSDSDLAASFLESEYEKLSSYPAEVRQPYEDKIVDALLALDTYDAEEDDQAVSAGPGTTLVSMETYFDASLRQRRHKGFVHWVTTPFRWVGTGLKRFWSGLTGKPAKKRRRRPTPGGGGMPSYPSYPTTPTTPGGGMQNSYPY